MESLEFICTFLEQNLLDSKFRAKKEEKKKLINLFETEHIF
jgi:hypothetical protein